MRKAAATSGGGSVILATLKRGKSWKKFWEGQYVEFKRNIPVEVSSELADTLEDEVDVINTDDGQKVEMDRFTIDRDAAPLISEDDSGPKRTRLRIKMEEVPVRPLRKSPVLKAPPKGFQARRRISEDD